MSSAEKFFRFDGQKTSVILYSGEATIPTLLYWGEKLPAAFEAQELLLLGERPLTFAALEREAPLSLFPQESEGFLGSPALAAHREGKHAIQKLQLCDVQSWEDGCTFQLEDQNAALRMNLQLRWSAHDDFLTSWSELENLGPETLSLDHLACPTLPLLPGENEVLALGGRWAGEFRWERSALTPNLALSIEQRSGRSGPEHFPGCVIGTAGFDETHGSVLGLHLAWSGNYKIRIERLRDGRGYVQAAGGFMPGEIQVEAGARFVTPRLMATRAMGLEALSQRFHSFLRREILPTWTRQPRPLLVNSWEAVYFDHERSRLEALVEAAAAIGAERFVLDDGWFLGRRDDRRGLGDWQVDPGVYPEGLRPLIDLVHENRMSFGLWVEPEMISRDSQLFRAHPEWVLQVPAYPWLEARHQLVLNLSVEAAYAAIKEQLDALLRSYPIDFLKWDMNRILVMAGDQEGRARAWQQTEAVYRLMDELRSAHPQLEIETCASGGGRVDFEILRRCGRAWTSDNNDPLERLRIQAGFSLFFPPEIMGAHVGSERAHISGRRSDPHLRAIVALQGQLGFELDLSRSAEAERAALVPYVALYKEHRHWIASSRVFRLPQLRPGLAGLGYVAAAQDRSLWWISSSASAPVSQEEPIKLRGLAPEQRYRLRVENQNKAELRRFMQKAPRLLEDDASIIASGAALMHGGASLPVLPPESCLLLSCHRLDA